MPKLPVLNAKQIIKVLLNHGFVRDHVTGSHYIFYHPENHKIVTVPYHNKDLPKGTLLSILRQSGIRREDISL